MDVPIHSKCHGSQRCKVQVQSARAQGRSRSAARSNSTKCCLSSSARKEPRSWRVRNASSRAACSGSVR
eukprot:6209399-Pleurochrysis_carterae.AAC.1